MAARCFATGPARHTEPIKRGTEYHLSTTSLETPVEESATPPAAPAIKRENAKIRPDLLRSYKVLAASQGRKLYDVMEEALQEYLDRQK